MAQFHVVFDLEGRQVFSVATSVQTLDKCGTTSDVIGHFNVGMSETVVLVLHV